MSVIDGRTVLGSGVIQFQKFADGDFGPHPLIKFKTADANGESSATSDVNGKVHTINVNIEEGEDCTGTHRYTVDDIEYITMFAVKRFRDSPVGRFYEARYNVALA